MVYKDLRYISQGEWLIMMSGSGTTPLSRRFAFRRTSEMFNIYREAQDLIITDVRLKANLRVRGRSGIMLHLDIGALALITCKAQIDCLSHRYKQTYV